LLSLKRTNHIANVDNFEISYKPNLEANDNRACAMSTKYLHVALLFALFVPTEGKIHHLSLREDSRRNILLAKFGYDTNGTLDFVLTNFTVPEVLVAATDAERKGADKFGIIGFTLSRGNAIMEGTRSNPHVCQLQQQDQGLDALFFVFDFTA
jgi:hypothetical protein